MKFGAKRLRHMPDRALRIIILEDVPEDIMLVDRELRKAGFIFSLVPVDTEEAFKKELGRRPDLILADYSLPCYDGLSALDAAKEKCPDVPFIFISGIMGEDFAGEVRKNGGTGYISKKSLHTLADALETVISGPMEAHAKVPETREPEAAEIGGKEKPSVIVIDDDANLRKTLTDIMRAKGYEVRPAKDGAEGLNLFKKQRSNLVLIDLDLPDMSGIEVLNRVKDASPSTQAIILTGNATLDSAIEATNKGAFSYLVKPYDVEQLLLHIKRAIEKQGAEEKIIKDSSELKTMNSELKTLYNVSLSISRTIEMEKLFPEILETLLSIEILSVESKAAIFLLEDDRLNLACHSGFSGEDAVACKKFRTGECLCGLAALKGEIVISKNSADDGRHTMGHTSTAPHGHIIVPLKSITKVVGVLCLYTRPDEDIGIKILNMLYSIGNQLGVAIGNARLYEEVKSSSLHDPLTGLANRRVLDVILQKGLARASRTGRPISVLMIDIDHFKKYNDTYGHLAGDKLLSEVGRIIEAKTREGDLSVRYGGEEFLMVLHETDLKGACVAAEAVRKTIEEKTGITVSLGAAAFSDSIKDKEELINLADGALYKAKQNGRNRVEASSR